MWDQKGTLVLLSFQIGHGELGIQGCLELGIRARVECNVTPSENEDPCICLPVHLQAENPNLCQNNPTMNRHPSVDLGGRVWGIIGRTRSDCAAMVARRPAPGSIELWTFEGKG